ncbi:hypothetical protein ATE84_0037 [Aquimarina sp. MAR_2010_214]|uniref:hypothetical protein n=1 Tax=Aquimarina sp. MAR_2010_214 TaxID=1250026 RepID=UPI000CBE600A|nr:hypothetical protein [Aquimarina sp. MAR_2010_214]PKV48054.1 hypothetical protein ATE84_0037 [Aquimarina sp. MAR_2010_214]
MEGQEGKFKPGDTVYAKANPEVKLIVRLYYRRIYYCTFAEDPKKKEVVFFERELL